MRPWLGLKRDKEIVTYFDGQTDRRTYPVIEMREGKLNISNEFRLIFCAVNVSFLHLSRKHYGRMDRLTDILSYRDARTHLKIAFFLPASLFPITARDNDATSCQWNDDVIT